ncbi:hypothetical protein [Comamonas sp.]|uniref:hypothetical protein n=1 Tax=Comamonas sp. TaxID=34028 RepID=UPI003A91F256
MTGRVQALAVAFAVGWLVNGWQADARIAKLELAQASKELQMAQQAITAMAGFKKGFNDALTNFQQTQQGNVQAQQDLGHLLLYLHSTTAGLRGDFAGLPTRIERANRSTLAEYASACTAVFEAMAAGGSRVAEAAGKLARKAEDHAADVKMVTSAAHEVDGKC